MPLPRKASRARLASARLRSLSASEKGRTRGIVSACGLPPNAPGDGLPPVEASEGRAFTALDSHVRKKRIQLRTGWFFLACQSRMWLISASTSTSGKSRCNASSRGRGWAARFHQADKKLLSPPASRSDLLFPIPFLIPRRVPIPYRKGTARPRTGAGSVPEWRPG